MAYVKRLLLLLAMGSVSVVLAGCYGVSTMYRINHTVSDTDGDGPRARSGVEDCRIP